MAEELALEEGLGQGRAVDLDEGRLVRGLFSWMAWANSSLPVPLSPRRSTEALRGGDLADALQDREHRGAFAHQVVEAVFLLEALAQHPGLGQEAPPLEGALDHELQLLDVHGLREVVLRPELHGPDRVLDRPIGRHDHDHGRGMHLADSAQELDPVHPGQAEVGEHEVGLLRLE